MLSTIYVLRYDNLAHYTCSYINVFKAKLASHSNPWKPLLHLLPLPTTIALQLFWLSAPAYNNSRIINSSLFIPFLGAWGLQFAHQVGRMILAHLTKQPFPIFDSLFLWSAVGAIDANLPLLLNRCVLRDPKECRSSHSHF